MSGLQLVRRRRAGILLPVICALVCVGCGPGPISARFAPDFSPVPGTLVSVGAVELGGNAARHASQDEPSAPTDLDIVGELRAQLETQLAEAGLLASTAPGEPTLLMATTIVTYQPGRDFVRPFPYFRGGPAEVAWADLVVACTLHQDGREIGTIDVQRESPEGWRAPAVDERKNIFETVAGDIVKALKKKLR
ncbi:MAG: hypothetical protein ACYS0G_04680 [Planctomycetota bacterium]|jgi:hypothetical protein